MSGENAGRDLRGSSEPIDQVTAIFANANSKTFKFQYWNVAEFDIQ
jgi:hypothetical protein